MSEIAVPPAFLRNARPDTVITVPSGWFSLLCQVKAAARAAKFAKIASMPDMFGTEMVRVVPVVRPDSWNCSFLVASVPSCTVKVAAEKLVDPGNAMSILPPP